VVLSVRCISSVSPRFCFRRHTFCFLPLAAILDSHVFYIKILRLFFRRNSPLVWEKLSVYGISEVVKFSDKACLGRAPIGN
jgi:hypothetical protein